MVSLVLFVIYLVLSCDLSCLVVSLVSCLVVSLVKRVCSLLSCLMISCVALSCQVVSYLPLAVLVFRSGGHFDKASDSCLYFEDITFHELVKCSSQKCSEEYQPLYSNAAQGSVNNCKHCNCKLMSFCNTTVFV